MWDEAAAEEAVKAVCGKVWWEEAVVAAAVLDERCASLVVCRAKSDDVDALGMMGAAVTVV